MVGGRDTNDDDRPSSRFHAVPAITAANNGNSDGWQPVEIFRHQGHVYEVWTGPGVDPDGPMAWQVREGTAQVAHLDLTSEQSRAGQAENDDRVTGTVLGSIVSFEQEQMKWTLTRDIEIRWGVRDRYSLTFTFNGPELRAYDDSPLVRFDDKGLQVTDEVEQPGLLIAILARSSGFLDLLAPNFIRSVIRRLN